VASLLQLYKPDVYATNSYGQTPVSLAGLRRLVAAIEEEQRLAQVQDLRNQPLSDLLFREADWERQVNEGKGEVDIYKKGTHPASKPTVQRMWDTYQAAWSDFVCIYGEGTEGVSSSKATVIEFKNVPWPFILRQGDQEGDDELLLSRLEVSGPELHSLIQQERLRWHPDKFLQLFGRQLSAADKDAVLLGAQTVCQLLNSLASELQHH
jgi:hypothetical protein